LNTLRRDPASAVPYLEQMQACFDENNVFTHPSGPKIKTREGAKAVAEAIEFLTQ